MERFVTLRHTREFPRSVPVAYAWLTDYRDDDPSRTNAVQRMRRVLERTPERVVFEGEIEIGSMRGPVLVEARLDPPAHWSARFMDGRMKGSEFDYRLTPTSGGCRIDITHRIRVTRWKHWLRVQLGRRLILRELGCMWDGFAAAMERETASQAVSAVA